MTQTTAPPDLTRIAGRILTKALRSWPEITHEGVTYSLTDEGEPSAVLWRIDPATYREERVARIRLTLEVEK